MAVPKETNKELFIAVEDETVSVAISPPVINGAIVVGQAPPTDPRTLLYNGYYGDVLNLKTMSGLVFQVGDVTEPIVNMLQQVLVGNSNGRPVIDGENTNRIYMDATGKGIYIWNEPSDSPWPNPQVIVTTGRPPGNFEQILIDPATRSIWTWL